MTTVGVGIFAPSAPLIIARSEGIFERLGLTVTYESVASSRAQFEDLSSGRYQLIQTAFDNVAHYRLNPSNPLGRKLPVRALFALDFGLDLSVIGGPGIRSISDLRGGVVSVDAPDTGFAFLLYSLLASAGLKKDADYTVTQHGGVLSRLERLLAGEANATLLSSGLEVVAMRRGLARLARSRDAVHPYLGSVVAASDEWLSGNRDAASRFRRAYEEALTFTFEPKNQRHVVERIAEARRTPLREAEEILAAELQDVGLARSTFLDSRAAETVLELRANWGGFGTDHDLRSLAAQGSPLFAEG